MNSAATGAMAINKTFGMAGCAEANSGESTSRRHEQGILMEKSSSSQKPEQPNVVEQDELTEERFIALYIELTGASEAQARSVYMYSDIIRNRDPYSHHFE
jgi:hypothetical protein